MENPDDNTAGLNNHECYYAWRTERAVLAWHRRELDECQNTAQELLLEPLLPLWHRCNLNFYLASVARLKDKPVYGRACLRQTLHYIDVLKQIDARNGEPEDAAYNDLKYHTEYLMMELEADIISSQEKELSEQRAPRPLTSFQINMRNIISYGTTRGPDNKGTGLDNNKDSDTDTQSSQQGASNGASVDASIDASFTKRDSDMEAVPRSSHDDLQSRPSSEALPLRTSIKEDSDTECRQTTGQYVAKLERRKGKQPTGMKLDIMRWADGKEQEDFWRENE